MSPKTADESRGSPLLLRRVDRQQRLVELLTTARRRMTMAELAGTLRVAERTVVRDVERLRLSGVPLLVTAGRGGGVELDAAGSPATVRLEVPELAALISSLAALGPTATDSAASAMRVLVRALTGTAAAPIAAIRVIADLVVRDLDEAKEFYSDFLGLSHEELNLGWVVRHTNPQTGAMVQLLTRDATAPEDPMISVQLPDADAAYAEAQRRGYEIVHPLCVEPWGVRRFFVRAPDGTVVNVVAHRT